MIERDLSQPDRIVGELLQPGGYLKLVELGMEGKRSDQITSLAYYCVCFFLESVCFFVQNVLVGLILSKYMAMHFIRRGNMQN